MKEARLPLIKKESGGGFTLPEVMIAVLVFTIGVGGIFAFLGNTVRFSPGLDNQLTAAYLAQEGVEIARNIRDSNYVEIASGGSPTWNTGMTGCAGDEYQADYSIGLVCFTGGQLNVDGNNYFGHGPGTATPFQRKIIIVPVPPDQLDITVEVTWQERGNTQSFAVETQLFDWAF